MPIPSTFLIDFDAFVEAYKYNARGYWLVGWGQDVHYSAICLYLEAIRTGLTSAPLTLDPNAILATLSLTSDQYFTTDPQFKYGFIQFLQTYHKNEPSTIELSFDTTSPIQIPDFNKMPKFELIKTLQEAAENIQKNFQQILDSTAVMIESLNSTIRDLTLDNNRLKDALPEQVITDIPTGPPPAAPAPPRAFSLPKALRFFKTGCKKVSTPDEQNQVPFSVTVSDLAKVKLKKVVNIPPKKAPKSEAESIIDSMKTAMNERRLFIMGKP